MPADGGARGVIKLHLKKDEAVSALKARAGTFIIKSYEAGNPTESAPKALEVFLKTMADDMEKVKTMKKDTNNLIQQGLRTIEIEKLVMLADIVGATQGRHTEEKIIKMIAVVFPQISSLDLAKQYIAKMQLDMVTFFMNIYAEEYNIYKNGVAAFDNETFRVHIKSEMDRREGAAEQASIKPKEGGCSIS